MLNIIYFKFFMVHILPNVNVFPRRQFFLLMLRLNMYNLKYKHIKKITCFLITLFVVMVVPHSFAFCCNNEYTSHTYIHDHVLQHFHKPLQDACCSPCSHFQNQCYTENKTVANFYLH